MKIDMNIAIVIFLVLFVLKMTGVIVWSWWFITLPLWLVPAMGIVALFLLVIIRAVV